MKILSLCAYYAPENFSDRYLLEDIFEGLAKRGHEVIVYSPSPCRGVSKQIRKEYKDKKEERFSNDKITVRRFPLYPESTNTASRAIRYIIQNIIQYYLGIKEKTDLLYAISTPPTQGILNVLLKKRKKAPFVYGLQDVFPDSLVSTGLTKEGSIAWRIGRIIETATYKGADKIVVIGGDMMENLRLKGVPEEKIQTIPNWIDTKKIKPVERSNNRLFDELELDRDRFYVVYAGDLGEAQGIDTLLDAARRLESNAHISFVIFGAGSRKKQIEKRVKAMNNVKLFPLMPKERIPEVYSLGDVSVVSCKGGLGKAALPSKTWSIMSTGTPVLLSFDKGTDLWNLISKNNCGICTEAGNEEALTEGIIKAYSLGEEKLKIYGNNGREYVSKNLSKDRCVNMYCDLFEECYSNSL